MKTPVLVLAVALAAGSVGGSAPAAPIAACVTTGSFTECPITTPGGFPNYIAAGKNNDLYFTETAAPRIGRITTSFAVEEFAISDGDLASTIVTDVEGNLWFTKLLADTIGRFKPATGAFTSYPTPISTAHPHGIARGDGDTIWFTQNGLGGGLARFDPADPENMTTFDAPLPLETAFDLTLGPDAGMWYPQANAKIGRVGFLSWTKECGPIAGLENQVPTSITTGSDGNLWLTVGNYWIVRMGVNCGFKTFTVPGDGPPPNAQPSSPGGMTSGPDGALWFVEKTGNRLGRITTDELISEYALPNPDSDLHDLAVGPDGALWFTERSASRIGRFELGDPPIRMQLVLRTYDCPPAPGTLLCYLWRTYLGTSGSASAEATVTIPRGRTYRFPTVRRAARAGQPVTVRGRLPATVARAVERALRQGVRPRLAVTVTGRDRLGNSHQVRRTVAIRG